ncbi:hypothetical protein QG142_09435 [Kingella kingae]|nr:hypothetical protein [Kingella kingae]MDK4537206.1 hypothetical protein [Kingella kingae]
MAYFLQHTFQDTTQFDTSEVIIKHFANGVLLMPKNKSWQSLQEAVNEFEAETFSGSLFIF